MSLIEKFKNGLLRSKSGFIGRLERLFGSGELNDEFYDELEEIMVAGDVGVVTSLKLVGQLTGRRRTPETESKRRDQGTFAAEFNQYLLCRRSHCSKG
jgi:fused signal recognition particle receptor